MKSPNTDDVIRLYTADPKHGMAEIAKLLGSTEWKVTEVLKRAGIKRRSASEASSLAKSKMTDEARAALSSKVRGIVTEMWSGLDRDQRLARCKNAIDAFARTRRPLTTAERGKMAISRERTGVEIGRNELEVASAIQSLGIPVSTQKAVGTYNLDLALDELPVAVEIDAGNFYRTNEHGRRFISKRLKYLLDSGWCVVFVVGLNNPGYPTNAAGIAQQIAALLERARSDKAVFGQYGVINRNGNRSAGPRSYLDGFARVEGL